MLHSRNRRDISESELLGVVGALRWEDFGASTNVEDRRGERSSWSVTEDGRMVGPNGEWQWDASANANQPQVNDTPTETEPRTAPTTVPVLTTR